MKNKPTYEELLKKVNDLENELKGYKESSCTNTHENKNESSQTKETEQKLKSEREKAQLYLDIAGVIILALNIHGEITLINQKGLEIFGYKKDEILGKNWFDHFLSKNIAVHEKKMFHLITNEEIAPIEVAENEILTKNRQVRVIEWKTTILKDENGNITGTLSSGEDITEQKETEKELIIAKEKAEESEKRLKRLFNNLNSGVAIYKPIDNGQEFIFTDINKAIEKIANVKKTEIIGKKISEVLPNINETPLPKALRQTYKSGKNIRLAPFYYGDNTRQGWREHHIYKLPTGEIVTIIDDVTRRKEFQQALIESENKFRTIYEMTEDMICIADIATTSFIDVNPSFMKVLGYNEYELLERPFLDFIHPEDVKDTIDIINNKLKKGKTIISFVNRYRCKDGNYRWFDWNAHPVKEKNIAYAIAHDVTELRNYQKELEKHKNNLEHLVNERTNLLEKTLKELKDTELQLIQSEKMASLGVLTAGVAHEINNPLNYIQSGIYGLKGLLKHELDKETFNEKINEIIRIMQVGIKRAVSIVKSLNTFSRKGGQEIKECNIHEIFDNCILLLNHEIKDKCTISKYYTEEKFKLEGNEQNLHQVFINLIMNSLQAIKSTGEISLSTKLNKELRLLEIVISDNGEGINQEHLNKIFDPFFTTKEPGKGVGIGLSIVYKIIKDHNGTVEYQSELSMGTSVIINLPVKV